MAFLAALERLLKIAKLAQLLIPEENDGSHAPLDPELLRQFLAEEE